MKSFLPFQRTHFVGEMLCTGDICNIREGIFILLKLNALCTHLTSKPFMAIYVDLNRKRHPRAESDVHQAEMAIHIIIVERKEFGRIPHQFGTSLAIAQPKRVILLIASNNANQSIRYSVAFSYSQSIFILTSLETMILIWATSIGGYFPCMLLN